MNTLLCEKRAASILVLLAMIGLFSAPRIVSAQDSAPPAAAPAPGAAPVGDDYIIGPGDTLQVFVWRNADLSVSVPVRPDGKISTPLVEDMLAVGKTPTQLARDIEQRLGEYVRSPQVNVIVSSASGIFSQVKVIGQVRTPQALPYRSGMRVLDVLLISGGMTEFAAGNRAKIVRTEGGKQREIRVRLTSLINNGDMNQNVELRPGDVLVIPESRL